MQTTVIYHSADFDGIFCREIARKFIPDAEFIGWNFGDPKIEVSLAPDRYLTVVQDGKLLRRAENLHILDLSPDCLDFPASDDWLPERLIWIDHHKTSIEKWNPGIPGYRIDGVAACRLAWEYFTGNHRDGQWPEKRHFVERLVSEPLAVRLAGEYDIWDKRDPRAETFQYALRCKEPNFTQLLGEHSAIEVKMMLEAGEVAQYYSKKVDESICNHLTWVMRWEGLNFLCVNHARFNSLLFAAKDKPETGHDALLGFRFDGKQWMVSLYHASHRKDIDLSEISKRHGGGGHRGACGFTCKQLPFSL